ncbi:MAG: OprD family outer membrane porin [Sulfuricurvum sp.]|nr:OprD family outer membrane porin [Sulfuricurvum sp.]
MTKLSIATVLLLGTAVFATAADDLASAFKEGKFDGRIRTQYFVTDWDMHDGTNKDATATGFAVGGSLLYKTAPLYGISVGAGLYTTQNPGGWTEADDGANMTTTSKFNATTSNDLFLREGSGTTPTSGTNPTKLVPYGEGYAVLVQSYLQYDIAQSKIKAGRFLMTNPWITPNDTKMIPIAIEGAEVISNDIGNTQVQVDYADKIKERGMTHFGNMADTGDTPDAIKAYYTTTYTNPSGTHGDAPDVTIVGITNKSIDSLELQGWVMHWPDLVDQGLIEANYAIEAGDAIVSLGGRFIKQNDKGAGTIIKPLTTSSTTGNGDNDNSIDSYLWAVRAVVNYASTQFLLSTSHTDDGADMIAPWRGFLTQGYTRSMTQTDWNANTDSYKAQLNNDLGQFVSGLSTMLSYSIYDRDPSKTPYQSMTNRAYQNDDTTQWNFDVLYKCSGSLKGLELFARFMDQNNDIDKTNVIGGTTTNAFDSSNREMRLEANYRF